MEELQKLVHILLNPTQNYSNEIKLNTQIACNKIIETHSLDYAFFYNLIQTTSDPYIKFWAIGSLGTIVEKFYNNHSIALKQNMHNLYFSILESNPAAILSDNFIENRYALLLISIIRADYPIKWPDAFTRLLGLLNIKSAMENMALKLKYTDFILSVLIEFDREIVEYYEGRTQEDFQRGREMKDELKKGTATEICQIIVQILENISFLVTNGIPNLVSKALECTEKLISWANLDNFLNMIPHLILLLENKDFQTKAARCILAILERGMEPVSKINIIQKNKLIEIFSEKIANLNLFDEDFSKEISLIMNKIGLFYLECYTGHEDLPEDIKNSIQTTFFILLQLAFKCLDNENINISINCLEFISQYINSLRNKVLSTINVDSLIFLLQIIIKRMQYPNFYDIDNLPENLSEDPYTNYRNELNSILSQMLTLSPIQHDLLKFIENLIVEIKSKYPDLTPHQKEAIFYIIFRIGEPLKDMSAMLKIGMLSKILDILISIPQIYTDLTGIVCIVMEIFSRYTQYFENHESQAETVISFYLSDKGVFSKKQKIASKAAQEFVRFNERLKMHTSLNKHYNSILEQLKLCIKETLAGNTKLSHDDLQFLYQAVGTILGYKGIGISIKYETLTELIESQKILLTKYGNTQKIVERVIKNLSFIIKGFDYEAPIELKPVLKQLAENAINAMKFFATDPTIRDTVILLFNKLVVALGSELLPLLKQLMELIIAQINDVNGINAIIKLTTLAILTWKSTGVSLAMEIFNFILAAVLKIGYPAAKISDLEKSDIDVIHSFIKFIRAIIGIYPQTLFSLPIDKFTDLLSYLEKWTFYSLDETLRKLIIGLFLSLLAATLGISQAIEGAPQIISNFLILDSKIQCILVIPEYQHHIKIFLKILENVSIKPFTILSPFNAIDMQAITDICGIHYLTYKIMGKTYLTLLQNWFADFCKIEPMKLEENLEGINKTRALKDYKDIIRKGLIEKNKSEQNKKNIA